MVYYGLCQPDCDRPRLGDRLPIGDPLRRQRAGNPESHPSPVGSAESLKPAVEVWLKTDRLPVEVYLVGLKTYLTWKILLWVWPISRSPATPRWLDAPGCFWALIRLLIRVLIRTYYDQPEGCRVGDQDDLVHPDLELMLRS